MFEKLEVKKNVMQRSEWKQYCTWFVDYIFGMITDVLNCFKKKYNFLRDLRAEDKILKSIDHLTSS